MASRDQIIKELRESNTSLTDEVQELKDIIETVLQNNMWSTAEILKNGLSSMASGYTVETLNEYVKKSYLEILKNTEKDAPTLERQIREHFSAYNDRQYETIETALLNNLWFTVRILDEGLRYMTAWYTVDSLTEYIKKVYIEIFNYKEKIRRRSPH